MNFKQKLSILFYLKGSKKSCDGKVPVYIRITIDGLAEEISLGFKVLEADWDCENKIVRPTDRQYKNTNKRIGQAKADLERHFDLMAAKNGIVTSILKGSYRTPINGQQLRLEKCRALHLVRNWMRLLRITLNIVPELKKPISLMQRLVWRNSSSLTVIMTNLKKLLRTL